MSTARSCLHHVPPGPDMIVGNQRSDRAASLASTCDSQEYEMDAGRDQRQVLPPTTTTRRHAEVGNDAGSVSRDAVHE